MRLYPRTKFADSNSVGQQVHHIGEEIDEFLDAYIDSNYEEAIIEAHDIIQSACTLMDILEREYPGQAWSALEEMVEKNRVRGYYREGK